jgi:hypothetical protein
MESRVRLAESSGRFQASKTQSLELVMVNFLKKVEEELSALPEVSAHPHRFEGRGFRFGNLCWADPYWRDSRYSVPSSIRDALLAERLAEEHHWVPNSGWITFRVRSEDDLKHALWLMRLSYLRYALKTACNPRGLLEQANQELHLEASVQVAARTVCT